MMGAVIIVVVMAVVVMVVVVAVLFRKKTPPRVVGDVDTAPEAPEAPEVDTAAPVPTTVPTPKPTKAVPTPKPTKAVPKPKPDRPVKKPRATPLQPPTVVVAKKPPNKNKTPQPVSQETNSGPQSVVAAARVDDADQPPFMRGLVPVRKALSAPPPQPTGGKRGPAIVVNLCRLGGAGSAPGSWASVAARASGMWMNTAGTDDWMVIAQKFKNRAAHLEVTPGNVKKGIVRAVLNGLGQVGVGIAHATWYLGDENIPIGKHFRKGTMAIAKSVLRDVTPCVTCLTGRGEWQTVGAGQQYMGKPGPPRSDLAGGAFQGAQCSGVTVEMPFEAYDCEEMLRAIRWCRANNKLCIMLAHTGTPSKYTAAARRAAEGYKKLGIWPDVIVPSNYGYGSVTGTDVKLPATPEGSGADYPNTLMGAARLLIDFRWK
jgi:hypothetical protein